jgi:hypothetical protein
MEDPTNIARNLSTSNSTATHNLGRVSRESFREYVKAYCESGWQKSLIEPALIPLDEWDSLAVAQLKSSLNKRPFAPFVIVDIANRRFPVFDVRRVQIDVATARVLTDQGDWLPLQLTNIAGIDSLPEGSVSVLQATSDPPGLLRKDFPTMPREQLEKDLEFASVKSALAQLHVDLEWGCFDSSQITFEYVIKRKLVRFRRLAWLLKALRRHGYPRVGEGWISPTGLEYLMHLEQEQTTQANRERQRAHRKPMPHG